VFDFGVGCVLLSGFIGCQYRVEYVNNVCHFDAYFDAAILYCNKSAGSFAL